MVNYSITQYGKPLDRDTYTIDLDVKTFSTEEMDLVFRQKYKNNIFYDRHPIIIAEFSKLNLMFGVHIVDYDDLKNWCDCYKRQKKFIHRVEIR